MKRYVRVSFFLIPYGASTSFSKGSVEEESHVYFSSQEEVCAVIGSRIGSGSVQDIENIHETSQDQENEIGQEGGCAPRKKEIRGETGKKAGEEIIAKAKAGKGKKAGIGKDFFESEGCPREEADSYQARA